MNRNPGLHLHPALGEQCPHLSRQAWDQLRGKNGGDWVRLLNRLPQWEEVMNRGGHHRFLNRHLPRGRNTIEVHFHPGRRYVSPSFLKLVLARLGLSEDDYRSLGFIH